MTPDANGLEPEQMSKRELAAENARLQADLDRAMRALRALGDGTAELSRLQSELARAEHDRDAALRTLAYLDDEGLTDAENARLRDVIARARREARSWPSRRVDHFAEGVDVILAESGVQAAPDANGLEPSAMPTKRELFDEVTRLRAALAAIVEAYDARTRGVVGTPLFAAIDAAREALR